MNNQNYNPNNNNNNHYQNNNDFNPNNQYQNQNYNPNNFNPDPNQQPFQPINSFDQNNNGYNEPLVGGHTFNPYDTQGSKFPDMHNSQENIPHDQMDNHETFDLKSRIYIKKN